MRPIKFEFIIFLILLFSSLTQSCAGDNLNSTKLNLIPQRSINSSSNSNNSSAVQKAQISPSLCANANLAICENFESETNNSALTTNTNFLINWNVLNQNGIYSNGSLTIDNNIAFRGSQSLHLHIDSNTQAIAAALQNQNLTNATALWDTQKTILSPKLNVLTSSSQNYFDSLWGRAFVYLKNPNNTNNLSTTNFFLITTTTSKTYLNANSLLNTYAVIELGSNGTTWLSALTPGSVAANDKINPIFVNAANNNQIPLDTWFCLQWSLLDYTALRQTNIIDANSSIGQQSTFALSTSESSDTILYSNSLIDQAFNRSLLSTAQQASLLNYVGTTIGLQTHHPNQQATLDIWFDEIAYSTAAPIDCDQ